MNIFLFTLSLLSPLILQSAAEELQLNLSRLAITELPPSYHDLPTENICKNIILQLHGDKKARRKIECAERTRMLEIAGGQEERSAIPISISQDPKGMASFILTEKEGKTFLSVLFGSWREDSFFSTGMRHINSANFDTIRSIGLEYVILGPNYTYGIASRDYKPVTEPVRDSAAQDRLNLMRQMYKELRQKTAVMFLNKTAIYTVHHRDIADWPNLKYLVMPEDTPEECSFSTKQQMRVRNVKVVYRGLSRKQREKLCDNQEIQVEEPAAGPITEATHRSNTYFAAAKKDAEVDLARNPSYLPLP